MVQQKLVNEISLDIPELFIIGKYVKIKFRNWESPSYFQSSRGQKVKNWTYDTVFVYVLDFIFYGNSRARIIYAISKWFNFVPGSFFEQDHLFTLIYLGVYLKRWPKCAYFRTETDVAQNLIDDFFF